MRTLTRALTVLTLVTAFAAVTAAQAVNVTGTWTFTVETGGGSGTPTVTFKQDGEKLTGHYSSQTLGEADFKRPVNQNVTVTPIKTFLKLRQAAVLSQLKALGVQ